MPIARFESQRNVRKVSKDQFLCFGKRFDRQRTLVIRIAAITLASDSAITITRFRPSMTERPRAEDGMSQKRLEDVSTRVFLISFRQGSALTKVDMRCRLWHICPLRTPQGARKEPFAEKKHVKLSLYKKAQTYHLLFCHPGYKEDKKRVEYLVSPKKWGVKQVAFRSSNASGGRIVLLLKFYTRKGRTWAITFRRGSYKSLFILNLGRFSLERIEHCQMVVFVADDLGLVGPGIPDLKTLLRCLDKVIEKKA